MICSKSVNLSQFLFAAIFLVAFYGAQSQTADFKVQHLQDDVGRTGGTNTSFTTLSSLNNAIELANNNRKVHAGPPTNGGTQDGDDMSGGRQLTGIGTLTYYREANSADRDARFNTSLWEYIGPASGGNEFVVRGRFAINLNGVTNSVTEPLTGIVNANKCIPFITGISNNATNDDADSATSIAYLEDATTLRIQKGSNGNNVTVYITVVEFTGTNWTVLHADSGNVSADSGSLTLYDGSDGTGNATNVSDWGEAVIFSHFRADTNASGTNDAISDLWPVVDPGNNNQTIDWTFNDNHDSAGTNRHFAHVLTNAGLNVTRFQNTAKTAGETTIDITSAGLSDVNQALIVGSSTTSGNGMAYGRGWRNYYLKSATQAAHWAHRTNNTLSHEIQIIDLSGLQTTYPGPEMNIHGNGINIPDGNTLISLTDGTDFGELESTGAVSVTNTFTIENLGNTDLTLDGLSPYVVITGDVADFTLTTIPTTPITAAGSVTFSITYDPTTAGSHTATVSIDNNDTDEDPYTFIIGGKGEYCASNGSTTYDTSITSVTFNTLSNADNEIPKDNAYEDFTAMSTNVYRNSTHSIRVNVNTDGNYTIYTNVWIDWNRDGDYEDAGEEYDLGFATNVVDGATSNSPFDITIPASAEIGSTGMRIATKWQSYPSSCDSGFDGEVEDYSINVIDYLIDFDGNTEYIDVGDNHNINGTFSLESWVLHETTVATGTIISNGNVDGTLKTGYHLTLNNGFPNLSWYDGANNEIINITSPYDIPNNEWHHIAATYDGATAKFYIDGIEVVSGATATPPVTTLQNFKIGAETANYASTAIKLNHFNGAMQEVRVWGIALTEDQIREMMNQHIIQDGANINGSEVPLTISGSLLWSNLLGYYPLDSNTAFDSSSYGIDGVPINIKSMQSITAPIPYETDGDSSWDTSTTWLNSTDVYIPNSLGVDGATAIDWNIVNLTNDINSGNRDVTLLGLVSTIGTLTIDGTYNVTTGIGTGQALTISNYLELDGVIDLVGESQLIQEDGSILDANSGGYIDRDQQGTANGFNFNYWSSSVGPIGGDTENRGTGIPATNANYAISGVLFDGTNPATYQTITFDASPFAADSNTPSSPITLSTSWFYKFYGADDDFNAWVTFDQTTAVLPAEGFSMKGTSGAADISTSFQNYGFRGQPNNGDITIELDKSSGEVNRLVGNPYPSAIDATQFILDNLSVADGGNNASGTVFNGALYFWDHFGSESSHYTSGYVGGYATRNLTGGVAAISNDDRVNNTSNGGGAAIGTKIPGPYIPVNQGFFVSTAIEGHNNNNSVPIATVVGGDVVFKNSQRVFSAEGVGASLFMRTAATNKGNAIIGKPKIRLKYSSPEGYYREIMLGADVNASENFDFGYDAFIVDVGQEDMYWVIDEGKLVIQGVNAINDTQEFPLGLIVNTTGFINISLEALENVPVYTNVYIRDDLSGDTYGINDEAFKMYLEAGVYDDRFIITFQPEALDVNEVELEKEFIVYFEQESSTVKIINKTNIQIFDVNLYSLVGQKIRLLNYSSSEVSIPETVSSAVYIVQLSTAKGLVNKKIIIK